MKRRRDCVSGAKLDLQTLDAVTRFPDLSPRDPHEMPIVRIAEGYHHVRPAAEQSGHARG
jgi:hypothetical protein